MGMVVDELVELFVLLMTRTEFIDVSSRRFSHLAFLFSCCLKGQQLCTRLTRYSWGR